jgi:uncharacterized protein YcfJ
MKMIALAVASTFAIAPALAQWDGPYRNSAPDRDRYADRDEYAQVIETTPSSASGRQECWNPRTGAFEERHDRRSGIGAGAAVGAVAGGVLGHQVDHGAGTAAGAILGGIVGHQVEKQANRDQDLDLSQCRMISDSAEPGYDVRYSYAGREYVAHLDYDPGSTLRLGTDVNEDGTPFA